MDFHIQLPEPTETYFRIGRMLKAFFPLIVVGILVTLLTLLLLLLNATCCWYFPGFGRYYRMYVQSRFLSMLGLLLEVNKPLPAALQILTDSRFFRGVAELRISQLGARIAQGEPLAECMRSLGLLPASMAPLVHAAERAHNLPWALTELGDVLGRRLVRNTQRLIMILFPLTVLAVAVLVAFVAYAMFVPLLQLMEGVA
jgi:type II secretory pathway component PulF